jgi:ABC-type protease/lipase transport system fused ATPase/permease subunit
VLLLAAVLSVAVLLRCTREDVLSLGEQQRLSLARCFYHRPVFAVLDECTSAVSIDVEERLYKSAISNGITCVTVSQRLSLPEFHATELLMGEDNADGHTVRAITKEMAEHANERDGRLDASDEAGSIYLASSTGESYASAPAAEPEA